MCNHYCKLYTANCVHASAESLWELRRSPANQESVPADVGLTCWAKTNAAVGPELAEAQAAVMSELNVD
jgi:hypothetical protein